MSSMPGFHRWLAGATLCLALCGCLPSAQGPLDEQKESHFLVGKQRANTLDVKGAIEAYEQALEANPQNGSAHFELGLLFEKEADYAAAIYHFERFLKLRPDSDYAQIVKERISADKMELSKTAAFSPVTQSLQREFEKLAEEKNQLRAELEKWRAEAEKWRAYATSRGATSNSMAGNLGGAGQPGGGTGGVGRPPASGGSSDLRPAAMRTHKVQPGETPTAIARKYKVSASSLMAANPGLDARRMKVGQTINVPGT